MIYTLSSSHVHTISINQSVVLIAYLQILAKNPHVGAWLLAYHTGSSSNRQALLVSFQVEDEASKLNVI